MFRKVHNFHVRVVPGQLCTGRFFLKLDDLKQWVIADAMWGERGTLYADAQPVPFEHYIHRFGVGQTKNENVESQFPLPYCLIFAEIE